LGFLEVRIPEFNNNKFSFLKIILLRKKHRALLLYDDLIGSKYFIKHQHLLSHGGFFG
jgi:hypothetical protein